MISSRLVPVLAWSKNFSGGANAAPRPHGPVAPGGGRLLWRAVGTNRKKTRQKLDSKKFVKLTDYTCA